MISNNQAVSCAYFDTLSPEYIKLIVQSQTQIYRNVNPVLTRRVSGRVLTLGSGPVMNFAANNVEHVICLDMSANMLARLSAPANVSRVCADAQAIPITEGVCDFVVIPFLIHHMAMDTTRQTDWAVRQMFRDARRALRRDGHIILVDLFLPRIFESVIRMFYNPVTRMLNNRRKPMMYFYSLSRLADILFDAQLRIDFDIPVHITGPLMPTLLFPAFKIPAVLHPARFHIIEIKKVL